jgi:integrase
MSETQTGQREDVRPFGRRKDGMLVKKIRGKIHYFGKDYAAALERWNREGADLLAGRTPRPDAEATTVRDACNSFLASKAAKRDRGGITGERWEQLKAVCDLLIETFTRHRLMDDLRPDDFAKLRAKMSNRFCASTAKVWIGKVKSVFRHAYLAGLIDREVRYGPDFTPPSAEEIRRVKSAKGPKMFERDEIKRLLAAGDKQDHAAILLGVNCGYQPADIAALRLDHLDLGDGWVTFARGKTGVGRRAKLWPETVQAIQEWLAVRPQDKDESTVGLVFLSRLRTAWTQHGNTRSFAERFQALAKTAGVPLGNRKGFATLRHTFRTQAGESGDREACGYVMGHIDPSMAGVYVQKISDARLARVADVVHAWLFPSVE